MAVSATEYLQFATRGHGCAFAYADRYVVTANGARVSVFDTVTHSSRAFDLSLVSMQTAGAGNIFSWSGRLFVVGYGAGSLWYLIELHLSDGAADVFATGVAHGGSVSVVATVVGNLLWLSGPSHLAYMNLSTMTAGTTVSTGSGFVAGSTAYLGTARWNATTGAALPTGSGTAPSAGAQNLVKVGNVVHRNVSNSILRWDTGTEADLSTIASASLGNLHLHTDGWLWSVAASNIRAFNPVSLAIRNETFPTTRAERVACVTVGGDLWAPSGYPI